MTQTDIARHKNAMKKQKKMEEAEDLPALLDDDSENEDEVRDPAPKKRVKK